MSQIHPLSPNLLSSDPTVQAKRLVAMVRGLSGDTSGRVLDAVASAKSCADPLSIVAEALVTLRNGQITEIDLRDDRPSTSRPLEHQRETRVTTGFMRPPRYVAAMAAARKPQVSPALLKPGPSWSD